MEIITRPFNGRNYWKKNGYTLLNGAAGSGGRRKIEVVYVESGERKRRWVLRVRKAAKVVVRWSSPKQVWLKLRDGYIKMMMRMAGNVGRLSGGTDFMGKRIESSSSRKVTARKNRVRDFEARLVLEIYKSLATSRGVSEL